MTSNHPPISTTTDIPSPSTPPPGPMTLLEPTPYVDPTPATPLAASPSARPRRHSDFGLALATTDGEAPHEPEEGDREDRSELRSIMLQFSEEGPRPTEEEVMSPRLEIASPVFGASGAGGLFGGGMAITGDATSSSARSSSNNLSSAHTHPPRKSSLEPLSTGQLQGLGLSEVVTGKTSVSSLGTTASFKTPMDQAEGDEERTKSVKGEEDKGPPVPPKDEGEEAQVEEDGAAAGGPQLAHRPPPPVADPEPALPFDFQRFLEQLRHRKADPIARYLKSFLSEFGKKQWMVHEQVKIISDFLAFIANKMAVCEVWRDVSDAEFDNAREGMEKLVMNRLYSQTFSPVIPPPVKTGRGRRGVGDRGAGPGRKGQHQEDVERDEVLTQKINIYSWIRPEHLDIPNIEDSGKRFLKLAQDELLKIKTYRAPRDKIICVLNCCKVIFGLLKHTKSDSSADSFMPLLIYVVLQCNPEHLVSNVQYILRFRNQDKLSGEAGYYLSSLLGAIQFIENMDRTTLTITDEEFEKNVETAVSAIAERHRLESPPLPPLPPQPASLSEKVAIAIAGSSAATPHHQAAPSGESSQTFAPSSSDPSSPSSPDGPAPLATLFQTIAQPLSTLSTIGRMFTDDPASPPLPPPRPIITPLAPITNPSAQPQAQAQAQQLVQGPPLEAPFQPLPRTHSLSAEEAAARQASAETAEARRLQEAQHADVVDTLKAMFPDLERDLISDVVHQQQGRVGLAVDACLALSS